MDTTWKQKLHISLTNEINKEESHRGFQKLRSQNSALKAHPTIEGLIGILRASKGVSYGEKDEAIHALLVATQTNPDARQLGINLLLVAMWPALDHLYYKLLPLSKHLPDLFSEIYWSFVREIEGFNLNRQTKIAVNLQMNTEKRVRRAVILELRYQQFTQAQSLFGSDLDLVLEDPWRNRIRQFQEIAERIPAKAWKAFLRQRARSPLAQEVSPIDCKSMIAVLANHGRKCGLTVMDQRVVEAHAIGGKKLSDIAKEMCVSNEAIRIRYFRATTKVQPSLVVAPSM